MCSRSDESFIFLTKYGHNGKQTGYSKIVLTLFQDPNEDTEWNDVLRKKGIIPQKEAEITEDAIVAMVSD